MFGFIKKFFLKRKAKKILSHIESLEMSFTIFAKIDNNEEKFAPIVYSLLKNGIYADIVSRYNVCIQRVENHNKEIQSLSFACNSLLDNYPVSNIV